MLFITVTTTVRDISINSFTVMEYASLSLNTMEIVLLDSVFVEVKYVCVWFTRNSYKGRGIKATSHKFYVILCSVKFWGGNNVEKCVNYTEISTVM